jgi:hypothetical protein
VRRLNIAFLLLVLSFAIHAHGASCEGLRNLNLPSTTITSAREIAAGTFKPSPEDLSGAGGDIEATGSAFKQLPAFCRIEAEIKPTADSDIRIEVWLPLNGWNKRLMSNGNGGFAGSIVKIALARSVAAGFAAVSTDTGHQGSPVDARWALGHAEKIVDFGWRAVHESTLKAKAIVQAFYGAAAEHSYFTGCSNGGRQGLMEAQRFPDDYDGIIAGAPAAYWTRLLASFGWDLQPGERDPAAYIPSSKVPAIAAAVLKACDAADGIADGIVNDPRACRFNPGVLLCKNGDADSCLTQPRIDALQRIYEGPRTASGEVINPGFSPGGEAGPGGWALWVTGQKPHQSLQYAFMSNYFGNMVANDANWDFKNFDLDRDWKLAEQKTGATLNATDTNLDKFRARGGKLILYHGWSDSAIPPLDAVKYYESMREAMGGSTVDSFARLYLAPGMQHCGGGPGPDEFGEFGLNPPFTDPQHNVFAALEQWVEKGSAPEAIIASHVERSHVEGSKTQPNIQRPLCPYPQVARYKGTGDINDAANFACTKP